MSKTRTAFFCSNCGYEAAKWAGKCPSCGSWNTFVEEVIQKDNGKADNGWKDLKEGEEGIEGGGLARNSRYRAGTNGYPRSRA